MHSPLDFVESINNMHQEMQMHCYAYLFSITHKNKNIISIAEFLHPWSMV